MNRMRAKLTLALVVGLGTGISAGVIYARHTIGVSNARMSQWAAVGTYAALAHLQYRYADQPHARAALLDFVNFAKRARADNKIPDLKAFAFDLAHAYMRLAGLDRRDGNMQGYRENVAEAQQVLDEFGVGGNVEGEMDRFLKEDAPESERDARVE